MAVKPSHLDNFREVYTLNFKHEKRSDNGRRLEDGNALKLLMWIPIVSNIMAIILFNAVVHVKALLPKKLPISPEA